MADESNTRAEVRFNEIYRHTDALAAFPEIRGLVRYGRSFVPVEIEALWHQFLEEAQLGDSEQAPDVEELQQRFANEVDVEGAIAEGWDDKEDVEKQLSRCFMFDFETSEARSNFLEMASGSPFVDVAAPYVPMELFASPEPESDLPDGQWALDLIGAPTVWDCAKGCEVLVAVVDTGIDTSHGDLFPNLWSYRSGTTIFPSPGDEVFSFGRCTYWPFTLIGFPEPVQDQNGHGTMVAGIIAGQNQNRHGIAGVAPDARLLAVKALGPSLELELELFPGWINHGAANGIVWSRRFGADVINCSWGSDTPGGFSPAIDSAIAFATAAPSATNSFTRPSIVVFAAGDLGIDISTLFPQNDPRVITVAATDPSDSKTASSNFGPAVDVAAPGDAILSTQSKLVLAGDEHEFATVSGTSFAAPHVSGMVALILQHHPDLSFDKVREVVQTYVSPVNSAGIGAGRIDLTDLAEILCGCGCGPCDFDQTLIERQLKVAAAQKEFDVPSRQCTGVHCRPLLPEALRLSPCFTLHWGDGPNDQLENDDREIVYITAQNPYRDLTLHGLTINRITIVPNQTTNNGHPTVELAASELICYDDLGPCESATREYGLLTHDAVAGPYELHIEHCIDSVEVHGPRLNTGKDIIDIVLVNS